MSARSLEGATGRVTLEERASPRGVRVTVDLEAVRANLREARRLSGGGFQCAVVKADAYGHGAVAIARALVREDTPAESRADGFAVVTTGEAIALREGGIRQPILVLQGPVDAADASRCAESGLWPVIHDLAQHEWFRRHARRGELAAWLKVDTGMGRLGVTPVEAERLLRESSGIRWYGVLSHFACADEPGNAHTRAQIERFAALHLPDRLVRSLANSAGIIAWPEARHDWARPGLMLYGCDPRWPNVALGAGGADGGATGVEPRGETGASRREATEARVTLRPAMRATTSLASVKSMAAGAGVGYGQSWRCPERMTIGLARVGYGDGLPRVLEGALVSVGGSDCPVVGRVSMDSIALDLRGAPDATIGDEVELWGGRLPVEAMAAAAGTIAYELLTAIRGTRQYIDTAPVENVSDLQADGPARERRGASA